VWTVKNITEDKVVRLSPVNTTEKFAPDSKGPLLWAMSVPQTVGTSALLPPQGSVTVTGAPKANIQIDQGYTRRAMLSKSISGSTGASKVLNPLGSVGECIRGVSNWGGDDIMPYLNTARSCVEAFLEVNPESKPLIGAAWAARLESASKLWNLFDFVNQL
jgi:hypothetical protein